MIGRIAWAVLAGGAAFLLLTFWRGFFWQHALIVGLGVTALVYSAGRAVDRLRWLHRR